MLLLFYAILLPIVFVGCVWTPQDLRRNNYSPHRPPLVNGTGPVQVFLKLRIISLLDVSEFGQSFTVDMDYRLTWNDYRLSLPKSRKDPPLVLDLSWRNKLWLPDIYFKNALQSRLVQGTATPITHISVAQNADVSLNARMTVKLICDMQLFAYPHDKQTCFLDSTSLSHEPSHIQLVWDHFSVDETIYFPKFMIDNYSTAPNCTEPNIHKVGSKSCVRAIVSLSRKLSSYLIRIYAPTILITCATFLGYYIDPGESSARVAINLTPFLSLIMMHNMINQEIKTSYVVALHIWMLVCMVITSVGLVVFFLVLASDDEWKEKQERELLVNQVNESACHDEFSKSKFDETCSGGPKNRFAGQNDFNLIVPEPSEGEHELIYSRRQEQVSLTSKFCNRIRAVVRRQRQDTKKEEWKAKQKAVVKFKKYSGVSVADAVARWVVPICYLTFITCYFVYLRNYAYFDSILPN